MYTNFGLPKLTSGLPKLTSFLVFLSFTLIFVKHAERYRRSKKAGKDEVLWSLKDQGAAGY